MARILLRNSKILVTESPYSGLISVPREVPLLPDSHSMLRIHAGIRGPLPFPAVAAIEDINPLAHTGAPDFRPPVSPAGLRPFLAYSLADRRDLAFRDSRRTRAHPGKMQAGTSGNAFSKEGEKTPPYITDEQAVLQPPRSFFYFLRSQTGSA